MFPKIRVRLGFHRKPIERRVSVLFAGKVLSISRVYESHAIGAQNGINGSFKSHQ